MNRTQRSAARTICFWTKTTPNPTAYARDHLRRALEALSMRGEVLDDTILAASEIIANATEHALGPYELRLRTSRGLIQIEVHDRGRQLPLLPCADAAVVPVVGDDFEGRSDGAVSQLSERGRGLALAHSLVDGRLSSRRTPMGKAVNIAVSVPHSSALQG